MAIKPPPEIVEQDFTALLGEIEELRVQLGALKELVQEESRKNDEGSEQVKAHLLSINEQLNKYHKNINFLEKRMDGMRSDASSGIILSMVVFAVLFVISFFVR